MTIGAHNEPTRSDAQREAAKHFVGVAEVIPFVPKRGGKYLKAVFAHILSEFVKPVLNMKTFEAAKTRFQATIPESLVVLRGLHHYIVCEFSRNPLLLESYKASLAHEKKPRKPTDFPVGWTEALESQWTKIREASLRQMELISNPAFETAFRARVHEDVAALEVNASVIEFWQTVIVHVRSQARGQRRQVPSWLDDASSLTVELLQLHTDRLTSLLPLERKLDPDIFERHAGVPSTLDELLACANGTNLEFLRTTLFVAEAKQHVERLLQLFATIEQGTCAAIRVDRMNDPPQLVVVLNVAETPTQAVETEAKLHRDWRNIVGSHPFRHVLPLVRPV